MSAALAGRGVLVTRPAARAGGLTRLIAAQGGEAVLFPTLEILSIKNKNSHISVVDERIIINGRHIDMLVFVSPTAVEQGWPAFADAAVASMTIPIAAVGRATARALQARGVARVLVPDGQADSEALAALPALQADVIRGRRVLVVRGEGGRDWLRDTLQARGAMVEYLECYRRVRPATDAAPLTARWRAGGIAAVTMTSREALDNLMAMLPEESRALARTTPLFASHPRIAEGARVLGIQQVFVTGAGDEAMVAGLQGFFATLA